MRGWIGSLVLVSGVAGLGWYATTETAPAIQSDIAGRAGAVAANSPHGVTVRTSGRDLVVSGRVAEGDRQELTAAFAGLDGVRQVDVSELQVLPVVSPFVLRLTQTARGLVGQGSIPSEDLRDMPGLGDSTSVQLADGAPDGMWADALQIGIAGLDLVQGGELVVMDRMLTLSGSVDTPADRAALDASLSALPDGYVLNDQVVLLDDGRPPFFVFSTADGQASGKLPLGLSASEVAGRLDLTDPSNLTEARIPLGDPAWPEALLTALTGAEALIEAELSLEGQTVTLSGRGTPDGVAQAQQALAGLPAGFDAALDLSLWDDGVPLTLTMTWDGAEALAQGKFPDGFIPRGPAGVEVSVDAERSFLADSAGKFTANAHAGAAALGLLASGSLTATATIVQIEGIAASPRVGQVMDDILANAAPDAEIIRSLTFLDDGSPAAWILTYEAEEGAKVEGRLPVGLTADDLARALAVDAVASNAVTAAEDDRQGRAAEVLDRVTAYLPDIEQLVLSQNDAGASVDLIVSPGVDIDLLATDLAENLPPDVAFSVGPLDPLPEQGRQRLNAATGLTEVFLDGFWIPDLEFSTTLDGCIKATQVQLEGAPIAFVSGSARLDAASLRALNRLAAVAVPCVEADLELEVAGHTDASGDPDQNQILSQQRAEAVRAALLARGIPARAITAIGFGASQPVADNDTAEGRAANRRTEISWFERGALRDP